MKKLLVLVISLLIITGCSVKYKLTINEDLTVTEEAMLTGTKDFFSNYYKTTKKNVIKSFLEQYKELLDSKNYTYEQIDDEIPYVNVKKNYNSVNEYINNTLLFNGYFNEVKYTEDGNIKKIETIGFNENNPQNPDRFDIKELEISIKCPYVVKNHNASTVDSKTNTYYYTLDKDSDYKILLEYDVSSKYNPNSKLIKQILIGLLLVIVMWIIIIVLNKKKKI